MFKYVPKNEKEKAVEESVSKLQLYVQEANTSIESTTHGIISTMPVIANDTKKLMEQAKQLKKKMNLLEKDITKSETAFSIANLERLADLKTKLEAAKNFLEQNDSFSKLTHELDDLLENEKKDISLACEKLFALQYSYQAQLGLAGQAERELVLEEFKNRLEASITSDVVKALAEYNVEESRKYVDMFEKIDRLPQMKNYYGTLQREQYYGAKWIEVTGSLENSDNQRFLADFYEFIIASWGKQLKWYRDVFKSDGVVETIQLITELLNSLHPTRENIISGYLKRISEKMDFLMDISTSNEKFATAIVEKIEENDWKLPLEKLTNLSNAVFNFFNIFIVQYSSIEQSLLNSQLEDTKILQTNSSDTIRSLDNSLVKIFEWVQQSIDRQTKITQNCAIVSLIYILNTFFKSFLEKMKKAQLQLDASSRNDHQDWNLLQICITFLQIIGNFKIKLDDVEETIKKMMLAKWKEIKSKEEFCYKLVGQRDISDFERITNRLIANETSVIFETLTTPIDGIAKDSHHMLLRLIFAPIEGFFKKLEISDSNDADLPDYSFSPFEYITEIGQFLLTLPQNLEPLLLNPAKPLKLALEMSDASYKENIPSADILLSLVADETCALYQEKILHVHSIGDGGAKQLATDIEYLGSVLEELGLTISSQLKQIAQLLKIKGEQYLTSSSGIDPRLVAAIRQMRNINITE
ncbi:CLUMA_CG018137, isoform A [Clunio marinus]|uniref:Conserved oligomeric Golgi complex subunit 7 n=1 Tax=Clunio marinus TaxID=568069 RepID=A0A1J1IZA0_9DIPT|nr:CLUMA_CG018137, isoform A [Clunio marinus]